MPNSLTLRVTHSGTTNASIYINDIHDGTYFTAIKV
jgi:hypothetical protein